MRAWTYALAAPAGLSIAVALAACASPTPARPPTPNGPVDLVVLHTNDNWGETEPCG